MLSNSWVVFDLEFLTFRSTEKILETIHIFEIKDLVMLLMRSRTTGYIIFSSIRLYNLIKANCNVELIVKIKIML